MSNHQPDSVYTKRFSDDKCCTAKVAKEVFFLNAADLSELPFERQKGFGAYALGTGACKYFNVNDVRDLAVEKFGCVESLRARLSPGTHGQQDRKEQLKRSEEKQRRRRRQNCRESEVPLLKRKAGSIELSQDRQVVRVLNHGEVVIVFGTNAVSTIGNLVRMQILGNIVYQVREKTKEVVFAENCPKMWVAGVHCAVTN
jgi:hypothetical protein